ncbi:hypothetical protein [Fulvivirga ligni]|uniref:hypothetical protein n=1 Tax=Fulvivirga ligni TaxID=2904246 RepID=UPI001F1F4176|nr:hypothetical protein [Fulvivirga ligni]UII20482.1 hypothetical protein LVD16_21830 [Fulvivirga ligni]
MELITLTAAAVSFIISIVLIWSILSIARSNKNIENYMEYIANQIYKANLHNGVLDNEISDVERKAREYDKLNRQ